MIAAASTSLSFADLGHIQLADLMHNSMHLNMLVPILCASAVAGMCTQWMAAIKDKVVAFIVTRCVRDWAVSAALCSRACWTKAHRKLSAAINTILGLGGGWDSGSLSAKAAMLCLLDSSTATAFDGVLYMVALPACAVAVF